MILQIPVVTINFNIFFIVIGYYLICLLFVTSAHYTSSYYRPPRYLFSRWIYYLSPPSCYLSSLSSHPTDSPYYPSSPSVGLSVVLCLSPYYYSFVLVSLINCLITSSVTTLSYSACINAS
jgi:hypothetical protein